MSRPAGRAPTTGTDEVVMLRAAGARLDIALLGATPLRWLVPWRGQVHDLLDGYRDQAELLSQDGVRGGVMAPFCNRVADGRYTFDGVEHDLLPGAADRTIYHGLVRTEPFVVVSHDHGPQTSSVVLRCTALTAGRAPGYPFEVTVDVHYRLDPDSLTLEVHGHNTGRSAAPFAAGWHPYLRLPGGPPVERLHLDVHGSTAIRTDDALVPLPGDAAYAPRVGPSWRPLGGAVLDAAFTSLDPQVSPLSASLGDPVTGARLDLEQDRGLVHVFTGDTLARDRRRSVAVEPVEAMTDALNRPECAGSLRLEPGTTRSFRSTVRLVDGATDAARPQA